MVEGFEKDEVGWIEKSEIIFGKPHLLSLAMILKRYLIVCWKEDLSSYLACIWIV